MLHAAAAARRCKEYARAEQAEPGPFLPEKPLRKRDGEYPRRQPGTGDGGVRHAAVAGRAPVKREGGVTAGTQMVRGGVGWERRSGGVPKG